MKKERLEQASAFGKDRVKKKKTRILLLISFPFLKEPQKRKRE